MGNLLYPNKLRHNRLNFNKLGFSFVCSGLYLFLSVLVVDGHIMGTRPISIDQNGMLQSLSLLY
jgi:hypothetical protein